MNRDVRLILIGSLITFAYGDALEGDWLGLGITLVASVLLLVETYGRPGKWKRRAPATPIEEDR